MNARAVAHEQFKHLTISIFRRHRQNAFSPECIFLESKLRTLLQHFLNFGILVVVNELLKAALRLILAIVYLAGVTPLVRERWIFKASFEKRDNFSVTALLRDGNQRVKKRVCPV